MSRDQKIGAGELVHVVLKADVYNPETGLRLEGGRLYVGSVLEADPVLGVFDVKVFAGDYATGPAPLGGPQDVIVPIAAIRHYFRAEPRVPVATEVHRYLVWVYERHSLSGRDPRRCRFGKGNPEQEIGFECEPDEVVESVFEVLASHYDSCRDDGPKVSVVDQSCFEVWGTAVGGGSADYFAVVTDITFRDEE